MPAPKIQVYSSDLCRVNLIDDLKWFRSEGWSIDNNCLWSSRLAESDNTGIERHTNTSPVHVVILTILCLWCGRVIFVESRDESQVHNPLESETYKTISSRVMTWSSHLNCPYTSSHWFASSSQTELKHFHYIVIQLSCHFTSLLHFQSIPQNKSMMPTLHGHDIAYKCCNKPR